VLPAQVANASSMCAVEAMRSAESRTWRLAPALVALIAGAIQVVLAAGPVAAQVVTQVVPTQEELKARVISRVDALLKAVDQQAAVNGATANKLAAVPPRQASPVLSDALHIDASIASAVPTSLRQSAAGGKQQIPRVTEAAQTSSISELQSRSGQLSEYADRLKALQNAIQAAPAEEVLTKLRSFVTSPRIAAIVYDPLGEALARNNSPVRKITEVGGSDSGLIPFVVGLGDASVDFPSVGAVVYRNSQSDIVTGCTGTLIAPSAVLTAAHCINLRDEDGKIYRPVGVFFQHAGFHAIDPAVPPVPNDRYRGSNFGDLGIIFLADSISEIRPASINTKARLKPGSLGRIIGFGYHNLPGSLATPENRNVIIKKTGIKIWATVRTAGCANAPSIICWQYSSASGDDNFGSTCSGDSGGPLFSQFDGGWLLAGVTRGGSPTSPCNPGDIAVDAEVYDFQTWIRNTLAIHHQASGSAQWKPLDGFENPENRYAVAISDSIFQPANPSFSKLFSLDPTAALVRVTLNTTPRGTGENGVVHLEVGQDGTSPLCKSTRDDTFLICDLPRPYSQGGDWAVRVSGLSGHEFQVVATIFSSTH
jgi:hypothetical protein